MYDPACATLAAHFLADTGGENDADAIAALAQVIQDKVEEWLEFDLRSQPCAQ